MNDNNNNDNNLLLPHYVHYSTPDSFNDIMSKSRKISLGDNNSVMLQHETENFVESSV